MSNRTINMDVGALLRVLDFCGHLRELKDRLKRVHPLKESETILVVRSRSKNRIGFSKSRSRIPNGAMSTVQPSSPPIRLCVQLRFVA